MGSDRVIVEMMEAAGEFLQGKRLLNWQIKYIALVSFRRGWKNQNLFYSLKRKEQQSAVNIEQSAS